MAPVIAATVDTEPTDAELDARAVALEVRGPEDYPVDHPGWARLAADVWPAPNVMPLCITPPDHPVCRTVLRAYGTRWPEPSPGDRVPQLPEPVPAG